MKEKIHKLTTLGIEAGFAAWFVVSVLSQHPQRLFDRFRLYDKIGLVIPNWRFFAPEPAVHDFHVLYRTQDKAGKVSLWREAFTVESRKPRHAIWFPGRRREKAVFDISIELMGSLRSTETERRQTPAYQLFSEAISRVIRESSNPEDKGAEFFQFMVLLYSGYDDSEDPQYKFFSPKIAVEKAAVAGNAVAS